MKKSTRELLFERMHTIGGMPLTEYKYDDSVDITNKPEFKSWFGASKVVDEKGNPLPVYHGSPIGGIEKFKKKNNNDRDGEDAVESSGLKEIGIFFTTNVDLAKRYASQKKINPSYVREIEKEIEKIDRILMKIRNNREYDQLTNEKDKLRSKLDGGIYQTYLKIVNPFIFDAKGKNGYYGWRELEIDVGYDIKKGIEAMEALAGLNPRYNSRYDGIIAKNIIDLHTQGDISQYQKFNSDVYVIFSPDQARIESSFGLY